MSENLKKIESPTQNKVVKTNNQKSDLPKKRRKRRTVNFK